MSRDVTAAIMSKNDTSRVGALYVILRASTFSEDQAVLVSRPDYDRLQTGMLVRVSRVGWGPISKWRIHM
ncbi:MAG TPA: hypothetical protein VGN32_08560 [Ktedonobacterales bacterium]|jgi:hypothetical protein|nr:hypothetical protein [Ktedonobacterales bacterium]